MNGGSRFDTSPQGFKQHRLHEVLVDPGSTDLTADVDFGAFKRAASSEGSWYFCH